MRPVITSIVTALLMGIGTLGCSDSGSSTARAPQPDRTTATTHRTARTATSSTTHAPDQSNDVDGDGDGNSDDYGYGYAASSADEQAVTALVKRYYLAAASGEGGKACTMIYSIFAEEIPEVYGESPGPPALRGSTCAEVMTKWFKLHHHELTTDLTQFAVTAVRVKARHALALLGFKRSPPHDIRVHLERGVWKIDEPLDSAVG